MYSIYVMWLILFYIITYARAMGAMIHIYIYS